MDVGSWRARGAWVPVAATPGALSHRLFVVHEGPTDAPDLLLLHGFPTSSWDWAGVWPRLTERFRCLTLDFLGFGFSDKPPRHRYSIFEQADLVEALLEQRGIREVHVLAHDYGDTVAQELLAREAERGAGQLRSVCFLNGGLFPETHRARPVQRLLRSPLAPLMVRFFSHRTFLRSFPRVFGPHTQPSVEDLDAWWSVLGTHDGVRALPAILAYLGERRRHRSRWVEPILDAPVPLQIINGQRDPVSGGHVIERFRELGGLAAVEELADIGHYPQCEAPARVLGAFLAWHDALAAGM